MKKIIFPFFGCLVTLFFLPSLLLAMGPGDTLPAPDIAPVDVPPVADDAGGGRPVPDDAGGGLSVDAEDAGEGVAPFIELRNPVDMSIEGIFRAILDIIMVFAIPIIVFFIIWAGFLYVTATGNPEQIQKAHKALLYAIIGGLIVLGANILLEVITNTIAAFAGS